MISIRSILAAIVAATLFAAPASAAQETAPPSCAAGQPSGDPLTVGGTGQQQSAPFALAGGAYRVDWTTAAPTTQLSFIELKSADDPSVLRSKTILNATAEGGATSGQTFLYTVKPGPHYLSVRLPAAWAVTLTPIAT